MLSFVLTGLFIFTTVPQNPCRGCDSTVARATVLCDNRHLDPRNLEESARLLDQVLKTDPSHVKALCERSRVFYFQAKGVESKKGKLKLYQQGMECGKRAIASDPHAADAHFWYLVNLGSCSKTKGNWSALNAVDEMKKEIGEVLKDDPGSPGALDVEANLYYELPGLMGGDLAKSLNDLTRAVQADSNFTRLYVDLAKVYIKEKNYSQARTCLTKALTIQNPSYPADDVLDDRPTALKLLRQLEAQGR